VAIRFQVIEKCQNELGIDVLHTKVGNLPSPMVGHESKQQGKAVPVAQQGATAEASAPGNVLRKELVQG
jgi:hypothetical protein